MTLLAINQFDDILMESAIGIIVVFTALTLLVLAFNLVGKLSRKSNSLKRKKKELQTEVIATPEKILSGNEIAAISMALHLFMNDVHDEESNVITIKRIERRYSPWNSKIYGLTNLIR
ncbi:MAG: OadG family protein [Paludibacter sp.]|jgi:Na+-transporting methylmalonyl-CoA/oxaloacetate decarboxylase gamma subunit|nr:OadG family protein [Paludibacter sp.]